MGENSFDDLNNLMGKDSFDDLINLMDTKNGFLLFHSCENLAHFGVQAANIKRMISINNAFIKKTEELIASGKSVPDADEFLRFAKLFKEFSYSKILEIFNLMENKEEESNGN